MAQPMAKNDKSEKKEQKEHKESREAKESAKESKEPAKQPYAKQDYVSPSSPLQATSMEDMKKHLPKDVQEKLDELKEKLDKFQKEVLKKFDKYVMGIALLPPQKDKDGNLEKDAVNLLVLVDDSDSQKMSKFELKDKLSVIIGKIGEETDKNFRVQTIILS